MGTNGGREHVGDDGLLTVPQVAHMLAVSRNMAWTLLYRGELVSLKIGRARRVPRKAVLAFIERNLAGAPAGR